MSQTAPDQEWPPSPYGASPPAPVPAPVPAPAPGSGAGAPTSTIVLLVVSGLITLTGVGLLWVGPAVLAILALVKHPADPAGARRLARIGWWVAGALAVLSVLAVVAVVGLLLLGTTLFTSPGTGYDPSTVGLTAALHALDALSVAAAR